MRVFEEFLVLKPVRITCIVLDPRMRHRHHDILALDHFHQVIRRTDMVDFAVLGIVLNQRLSRRASIGPKNRVREQQIRMTAQNAAVELLIRHDKEILV